MTTYIVQMTAILHALSRILMPIKMLLTCYTGRLLILSDYCFWFQRAHLKGFKTSKHTSAAPITLSTQLSQTFFSSEHHQSCFASEVIYLRHRHRQVQRVKRKRDEEGKQTQTPVECLSSLAGLRTCSYVSALATAAGKEGMPHSSPTRYQLHPHHSCTASDPPRKH